MHHTHNHLRAALWAVLVAAFVGGGCQTSHPVPTAYPDVPGRHRSIVLDADTVAHVSTRDRAYGQGLPWYAWRNDVGRSAVVGHQGPTHDRSVTITHDRQTITNGRVRDHFTTTTHSVRITSRTR